MNKKSKHIKKTASSYELQENHYKLINALESLLDGSTSFDEIKVSDITDRAGISRSNFYNYFVDKNELLRACFEKIQHDIVDSGVDWWMIPGTPTEQKIADLVTQAATKYHQHRKLLVIAISEVSASDVATRKLFESIVNRAVKGLTKYIRDCQAKGWTETSMLPAETAMWLTATAARVYQQTAGSGICSLEEFSQEFSRFFYSVLFSSSLGKNPFS